LKVALDACVIFPTVLREILLGVAQLGLYEPVWSERILQEWVRATHKLGPLAKIQAEAEARLMQARFPRAMQRAFKEIEAGLLLPDPDDVHVLATAIGGHADALITFNAVDFPRHVLATHGIARRDPDGFLWELWSHHPDMVGPVVHKVHLTAQNMAGKDIAFKPFMRRAQLPKLGTAMQS
jgi:predicted nucleic acid-binding protein